MSKLSFLDKLKILFEVSKSSYLFIVLILILLVIGIFFFTTNKKNAKRNKTIYIVVSVFIIVLLAAFYYSSIGKMFDYMMNNLFIAIYFPNLAIYFAALIIMNIILWVSIFNFKTSEYIKRLNIVVYIIMNYLLALILSVIHTEKLDVFNQSSIYQNQKATALIELSSIIFIVWILFLIIYKLVLIYIRKDYKPKVKRIIVRRKVKKLPENFSPVEVPTYMYGNAGKLVDVKYNNVISQKIPDNIVYVNQSDIDKDYLKERAVAYEKELTKEFEKMLTVDDYRLLLKLLKEQKDREQLNREDITITKEELEEREETLRQNELKLEKIRQQELEREQQRQEEIRKQIITEEKKIYDEINQEKIKIDNLKEAAENEERKFTELEMLYKSIS